MWLVSIVTLMRWYTMLTSELTLPCLKVNKPDVALFQIYNVALRILTRAGNKNWQGRIFLNDNLSLTRSHSWQTWSSDCGTSLMPIEWFMFILHYVQIVMQNLPTPQLHHNRTRTILIFKTHGPTYIHTYWAPFTSVTSTDYSQD